jgi:5-methylcytosine-specific restriction protein A
VGEFNLNKMDAKSYYKKLIQSQRWVKLRALKVANNPLCERCLLDDITTPSEEVHHIRPVESAPDRHTMLLLCFDYNNLQSLCSKCHKAVHVELKSYTKEEAQKRNKEKTDNFVAKFLKRHNPP